MLFDIRSSGLQYFAFVCSLGNFCKCLAWWNHARINRTNDTVSIVAR